MGRAPCCDKDGMKKGPWLPEEDQKLIDYIEKHGPGNWRNLPKKAGLQRCGKSCRLRWTNYLRPDIKRGRFSFEEEETIIQLHSVLGNKWSAIAAKLPGRTDNEIKNYWNTHIRKRLLRMGIDPVTHTRRLDLLNIPSILSSSLQNQSQLNLLKLLSLQNLINNPQLLRLATLLSTSQNQNQNFLPQNIIQPNNDQSVPTTSLLQNNQLNSNIQIVPNCSTPLSNLVCAKTKEINPYLEQNPTNISNFNAHNLENQWKNDVGFAQDSKDAMQNQINLAISSDEQAFMDRLFDNSAFMLEDNKQSLNISSMFSSPCSSQQTPLSSNSMYPNGSTSSSSCEDETDSYCDNLLNFDIPIDLFDLGRSC